MAWSFPSVLETVTSRVLRRTASRANHRRRAPPIRRAAAGGGRQLGAALQPSADPDDSTGEPTPRRLRPFRLLIRTATNAYFSQVVSVLSIPEKDTAVKAAVRELWEFLQAVDSVESLSVFQRLPKVARRLEAFSDDEVLEAIDEIRAGKGEDKPVKLGGSVVAGRTTRSPLGNAAGDDHRWRC